MESQQQMLKQNVHVFIWVDYIQPQVCILECGVKKNIYLKNKCSLLRIECIVFSSKL